MIFIFQNNTKCIIYFLIYVNICSKEAVSADSKVNREGRIMKVIFPWSLGHNPVKVCTIPCFAGAYMVLSLRGASMK